MSKVRINNEELESISNHIKEAENVLNEIEEIWGINFDNLCHNFGVDSNGGIISGGFLESLYKDAESQYYHLANLGYVISYTAGGFGSGAFAGTIVGSVVPGLGNVAVGTIGGIIGAVIGFFKGIYHCVKNPTEIKWSYESRTVFADLLSRCANGDEDNYTAIVNGLTKLANMQLAIVNIRTKINEYNEMYTNLADSAAEAGIKTVLADDGMTVLGIETEVTIDGQIVKTTTSEALNAFYTYNETVMSAEIAADYLHRTYGLDINYMDIVKNANTFMTNTLNSGLYTHEFISGVLPEYTPDEALAKKNAAGITGLTEDQIEKAIANSKGVAGAAILAGSLLGIPMLGQLISSNNDTGAKPGTTPSGGPSGSNGNNGNNGNNGGNNNNNGGNNNGGTNPPEKEPEKDPAKEPEKEPEKKPVNEIKIPEIVETKIPEKIESVYEVDFDQLAREQFEFEGDFDKIMEDRANLITQVESQYDNGDLTSLSKQLTDFGYNSAEVTAILGSKFLTSKAILEGTQNSMLAAKAQELAKQAGVEDFVSKYSERPNFSSLSETEPSDNLVLTSGDKNVVKSYDTMKEKREEYTGKVKDANEALVDVNESKKTMEELKAKYEKEYGEDTTQWSEEAAKEYSKSIEDYNSKVEAANDKVKEAEEAQKAYEEANKEFNEAKENYLKNGNTSETVNGATSSEPADTNGITGDFSQNGINSGVNNEFGINPDMNGVVVDGVVQGNTAQNVAVNQTPITMNTNSGIDQNMINGAAMMNTTEQILNSIKEEDGNLIST